MYMDKSDKIALPDVNKCSKDHSVFLSFSYAFFGNVMSCGGSTRDCMYQVSLLDTLLVAALSFLNNCAKAKNSRT